MCSDKNLEQYYPIRLIELLSINVLNDLVNIYGRGPTGFGKADSESLRSMDGLESMTPHTKNDDYNILTNRRPQYVFVTRVCTDQVAQRVHGDEQKVANGKTRTEKLHNVGLSNQKYSTGFEHYTIAVVSG